VLLLGMPAAAAAHEGVHHAEGSAHVLLTGWTADPATLIPLVIASAWYAAGVRRSIREHRNAAVPPVRIAAFVAGTVVLVLALQSPIDTLGEDLFSIHMIQHLLLMLAAPPLLVLSDCTMVFLRALPLSARKRVGGIWVRGGLHRLYEPVMHPVVVWMAFSAAFVFWHSPGPYQWALDNPAVHILEHLSFFVTSLAFWTIALPPRGHRRRLAHGPTLLFVISTAVLSGLPGALMIFSPRPLYPGHAQGVAHWGLTLMQDQQLAGLIMWIPAGGAYVAVAGIVFLQWLRESESRAVRLARRAAPLIVLMTLAGLILTGCNDSKASGIVNFGGDANRGARLIAQYGCGHCHTIPNIIHADGNVGPPLQRVGTRTYIAGVLNNTPDNMSLWIESPQKVVPGNAMPAMGIPHQDARDITAYLYTLK
jgi:cytochrome c oxidase assembly factor CtaG/cytochrome c2